MICAFAAKRPAFGNGVGERNDEDGPNDGTECLLPQVAISLVQPVLAWRIEDVDIKCVLEQPMPTPPRSSSARNSSRRSTQRLGNQACKRARKLKQWPTENILAVE